MIRFELTVVKFEGAATVSDGRVTLTGSRGYAVRNVNGEASITCLVCGFTSRNPNDVEQKYCGHCHKFHEE